MAGTRGGAGRIAAMVAALALALVLALASPARGDEVALSSPLGLMVEGGDDWRAENDFDLFWTDPFGPQVIGANWRLVGDGYTGAVQWTPGLGIDELRDVRVPGPGLWYLTLWLSDESGTDWEVLGETVQLRLDDVPPAVSFMPGDAQLLSPQLVAAVADPLSGVADGTIFFRRRDEEHWAALPTQIRTGAFGTELAAPTPQLKPGTAYEFRVEALDHAGNLASATTRADGAPMQFPPPSVPGAPAADGRRELRRTRLLAALAGRRRSRGRQITVAAGEPTVVRGMLADGDGGLRGRRLRIAITPLGGAAGGREVESVTTGPGGRFASRLAPGPSRRLTVAFAGAEDLRPARRRLTLRVRAAVTLRAAPRHLATGDALRLEGRVGSRGARLPRAGKLVTISYWEREARRWRPVILTRTDRRGRFRARYRFRYVTGRARIRLRAQAPAEARWPYAPGVSAPVTIEVRGSEPA